MTPDREQRAAETALRVALERGWVAPAVLDEARREAERTGRPVLQALGPRIDGERQQQLAQVYREALASSAPTPTDATRWEEPAPPAGAPDPRTRAGGTVVGAPVDLDATRAADVPAGVTAPPGDLTWMTYVRGSSPPPASAPTAADDATYDPGATAARGGARPPSRVGPYEVERELARGGMGAVYLARHVELGRPVALKLMLNETSPAEAARFEREARVLARLRHPNVVVLHDAGEDGGRRWLALELVGGGSLKDRLDRAGPLEPRAAAELMEPVARAIAAAHAEGLLHRDLKPANVLVDEAGRPKVTDFGIAKPLDAHTQQLTRTGVAMGTPGFAAPEQCFGEPVDARTDVYALGATLHALLTGRPPFVGGFHEVAAQLVRAQPPPPSRLRPGVPRELDRVVARCLEREPAERYPTAEALADDLARFLRGEALVAPELTAARRVRRWGRRHPLAAAGLVAGSLVGVVAVVAALTLRATPSPPPVDPTRVEWAAPADGEESQATSITARGVVRGAAEWVELTVEGQPRGRRVRGGEPFELLVPLRPGDNVLSLRWRASTGEEGVVGPRRVRSDPVPAWYRDLAPADRPPLPLPAGLAFGEVPRSYVNHEDGSKLVWIPPGTFVMFARGADVLDPTVRPEDHPRRTTISRGFFLGQFEVTFRQFDAFCEATDRPTPSRMIDWDVRDTRGGVDMSDVVLLRTPFVAGPDHPVFGVTWREARAYCDWAGLRLPTEAEWEWAARGPEGHIHAWGDELPRPGDANGRLPDDGYTHTAPVGTFERDRTRWLCFDMTGNVGEWVGDFFGDIGPDPVTDPTGPTTGRDRVSRGAPWHHAAATLRLTVRHQIDPTKREENRGFRVAR